MKNVIKGIKREENTSKEYVWELEYGEKEIRLNCDGSNVLLIQDDGELWLFKHNIPSGFKFIL